MRKALVCVSFGTTVANGRVDLSAVEQALQKSAPEYPLCTGVGQQNHPETSGCPGRGV